MASPGFKIRVRLAFGKRPFARVEAQAGHPGLFIRTVAGEAIVRENRPNLARKVYLFGIVRFNVRGRRECDWEGKSRGYEPKLLQSGSVFNRLAHIDLDGR